MLTGVWPGTKSRSVCPRNCGNSKALVGMASGWSLTPECFLGDQESLSSPLSLSFLDQSFKIKKTLGTEILLLC